MVNIVHCLHLLVIRILTELYGVFDSVRQSQLLQLLT